MKENGSYAAWAMGSIALGTVPLAMAGKTADASKPRYFYQDLRCRVLLG